jgi:hypothetical protein
MNDIYKPPEAEVASAIPAEKELVYDIEGIERYRWFMGASLATWYIGSRVIGFALPGYPQVTSIVIGLAVIANLVCFAVLAAKIYQNKWITTLCVVLSLIPLVNLIACIFMNIKAKEVVRYAR